MKKYIIVLVILLFCASLVSGDLNEDNCYVSNTRIVPKDTTMDIYPSSVNTNVPCGDTTTVTLTVTNNGTAALNWSTLIVNDTKQPKEDFLGKDTWDLQFTWASYAPINTELGIETNGTYFYTTSQNVSGGFFRYQMDGLYVGQFTIPEVPYTLNEITYDGQYFYGCTLDANIIYILDLDNEQLVGTITTVADGAITAIAYDCDSDGFWIRCMYGIGDNIILVDRSGTCIGSISFEPEIYSGLVYDQYSDGGPYLWAFHECEGKIFQIEVSTGTLTGFSFDVCDNLGIISLAGGLFIAENDFSQGIVTIGGFLPNSKLCFGYELCLYHPRWMSLNPTSGTVASSGGSEEVTLFFDAHDYPEGTIHTCGIQFEAVQNVSPVTVPVTFYVGTPSYGDITGTVTAATGGELIEGAEVTVLSNADISYVAYTNSSGIYFLEDIITGIYTIECKSDRYNTQQISNVEITADEIATVDIEMTAPVMVVDSTSIYTYVDPNSPVQIDITIQNTGDGPLEWNALVAERKTEESTKPATNINFSRGSVVASSDTAPLEERPACDYTKSGKPFLSESIGYGYQAVSPEEVFWVDTSTPDVFNNLFIPDFYTHAGEFPNGTDTHMYFCDKFTYYLIDVDITSGDADLVGPIGLDSYVDDLACDRTTGIMYGLHENTIYTADLDNGHFTEVGPIGNGCGMMIAIAIDGNGNMWGHDIIHNEIWHIDKATGAGTSIGSTGFEANYAQSMAWDPVTDTVYLAAFNSVSYYYQFRSVDLTTGWTTLLGEIYYYEVTALAFPGELTTPWITLAPSTDIVPVNGSSTLSVNLNTIDHSIGDVLYSEIQIYSEPDVGIVTIPVVVIVGSNSINENPQIQKSTLFDNFPNPIVNMTNFKFSLKNNTHAVLSVYNLKGQLIDVLFDDELGPVDEYTVQWDCKINGKDISNGVYFYKLETDSKSLIKKMLLMR